MEISPGGPAGTGTADSAAATVAEAGLGAPLAPPWEPPDAPHTQTAGPSLGNPGNPGNPVALSLRWEHGRLAAVQTASRDVADFLDFVHERHPYNTWVNYACDLKVFFATVGTLPDQVTRADCVRFMSAQGAAQRAVNTINRRLAAISSLFDELMLRDPARFSDNPVSPRMG